MTRVLPAEQLVALQHLVRRLPAPPTVVKYAVALARSTRPDDAVSAYEKALAIGKGNKELLQTLGRYLEWLLPGQSRAVIGELPSSIQDGLGGWIINFNQYYALEPENLWAVNLVASLLGISFFLVVVLVEKLVVQLDGQ